MSFFNNPILILLLLSACGRLAHIAGSRGSNTKNSELSSHEWINESTAVQGIPIKIPSKLLSLTDLPNPLPTVPKLFQHKFIDGLLRISSPQFAELPGCQGVREDEESGVSFGNVDSGLMVIVQGPLNCDNSDQHYLTLDYSCQQIDRTATVYFALQDFADLDFYDLSKCSQKQNEEHAKLVYRVKNLKLDIFVRDFEGSLYRTPPGLSIDVVKAPIDGRAGKYLIQIIARDSNGQVMREIALKQSTADYTDLFPSGDRSVVEIRKGILFSRKADMIGSSVLVRGREYFRKIKFIHREVAPSYLGALDRRIRVAYNGIADLGASKTAEVCLDQPDISEGLQQTAMARGVLMFHVEEEDQDPQAEGLSQQYAVCEIYRLKTNVDKIAIVSDETYNNRGITKDGDSPPHRSGMAQSHQSMAWFGHICPNH